MASLSEQITGFLQGITRGKRLLVLVGQKKALGIAVRNDRPQRRYSGLLASLKNSKRSALA
jgi:ATP-dependent exoDNAse (exonuclease V) alpha subunit